MTFFNEHIKQEVRNKNRYFTILNPTEEQEFYIKEIIQNSTKNIEDENGELIAQGTFGYDLIKWAVVELTNVGEEIKDLDGDEFMKLIEAGDEVVEELMYQIEGLLRYVGVKVTREQERLIDTVEQSIELLTIGNKIDNTKSKIVKMFRDKGIDIPADECLQLLNDPKRLEEALKEAEKNKPKSTKTRTKIKSKKTKK